MKYLINLQYFLIFCLRKKKKYIYIYISQMGLCEIKGEQEVPNAT